MLPLLLTCLTACLAVSAGQIVGSQLTDRLNVPPGFSVNVFSNATSGARSLAISQNASYAGTILYVSTDTSVCHSSWDLIESQHAMQSHCVLHTGLLTQAINAQILAELHPSYLLLCQG